MRKKKGKKWIAICKGCNLKCTVPSHYRMNVYKDDPYSMDNKHKCKRMLAIEAAVYANFNKNNYQKTNRIIKLEDEYWLKLTEKMILPAK